MRDTDDLQRADEEAQQQDEERAYIRCLELIQLAVRGHHFEGKDLQDLWYHLGMNNRLGRVCNSDSQIVSEWTASNYFKEKA